MVRFIGAAPEEKQEWTCIFFKYSLRFIFIGEKFIIVELVMGIYTNFTLQNF